MAKKRSKSKSSKHSNIKSAHNHKDIVLKEIDVKWGDASSSSELSLDHDAEPDNGCRSS